MLPLQGSRRGGTRRSSMAAENFSSHKKKATITDMAVDAEGGYAVMDVGRAFLNQSQIRGMLLTALSCLF